jgi:N-acetylmuramoyl-L-alanine amidase
MRSIDTLVIHCSASANGDSLFRGARTPVALIDEWHQARGFKRGAEWRARQNPLLAAIGYHYVIYLNGAIASGRSVGEVGAHARGQNATSVGICLIGTDQFTPAAWRSLREIVVALRKGDPTVRVVGHNELPDVKKSCPGFSVADWLRGDMQPPAAHLREVAHG